MSPKSFAGKVAIVTGGASGLGQAISAHLAREGATVVVFDRQDAPGFTVHRVDVTDEAQVAAAVAQVAAAHGRIDLLVNSAGITGKTNLRSHEVDSADFERVMQINVRGPFLLSKHVLPHMLKNGYGRILHIASIAGKEGNAGMLAYSASKAAVIGMTKVQGKEYAESGITVNAMAPAVVETPMVKAMPAKQVEYMTSKIPMRRCCTLDEVVALAAHILSPGASFTTGFTYDLTGGRAVY